MLRPEPCAIPFSMPRTNAAMEALHHAACDDSHHAAMPAFARENQRRVAIGDGLLDALLENGFADFFFGLLAVLIELVKLRGERAGARVVFGEEHFDHVAGAGHPSSGVEDRKSTRLNSSH